VGHAAATQAEDTRTARLQLKAHDYISNRRSARLANMVKNLHESMKQMIEKREFYSERSKELELKLRDASPESLASIVEIRTIHIADIMMELEDVHELKEKLEEKYRKLQEEKDEDQQANQTTIQLLRKQVEILELRSKTKHEELLVDLKEANEESAALQEMYRSMRRNFSSATMNIATMASTISKLQQENNSLRVEADNSHKALIALELQQENLSDSDRAPLDGQSLESQLAAARFETDKLVAERTANQTVIGELRSQVRMLQAALAYQSRSSHRIGLQPAGVSPDTMSLDESDILSGEQEVAVVRDCTQRLDKLLSIGHSMRTDENDSECEKSVSSFQTDATPKQANTSADLDGPVKILQQSPASPSYPPRFSQKARRMPVEINGMEGSYTGPTNEGGLPHGTGTIRFRNGDTYLGALDNGKMHGRGAIYFANKRKPTFRGDFVANRPVM